MKTKFSPWAPIALAGAAAWKWSQSRRQARRLRGKVIVITGGSRGLGLALARRFARRGARLAICARTGAQLERAAAELRSRGASVLAVRCDLRDPEQVRDFARQVLERYGHIDVLVNNAGIIQVGPFEAWREREFADAMDAIFWSALRMTLAFRDHLAPGSRIVNIVSIGGAVAVPHLLPYSAAKFALRGLSEGLGTELAHRGIRVITVLPGLMRTGSFGNALVKGKRSAETDWFSLGASLPGLSMSADRAAARIVAACVRGSPIVVLGMPAKILRLSHGLAPGAVIRAMKLVHRLLPDAPATARAQDAEPGHRHRGPISRSILVRAGERAARKYNEVA